MGAYIEDLVRVIMDNTAEYIGKIETIVAPLIGMKPWSVRLGIGSLLNFEFGKELKDEGYIHATGEWHLWVYMCAWRLQTAHDVLVGSEDFRDLIQYEIQRLEGKTLESIKLSWPALETEILFETGLLLRLFPIYTSDHDHWMLFTPDRKVLTIGPGNTWSYERSDDEED